MKLALMLSGEFGDKMLKHLSEAHNIVSVFTDAKSTGIREFCDARAIPIFVGNPRNGAASSFVGDKQCDVLLSINYLFIVEKDLMDWPSKFPINIHGSLLPKYRGRTPHVWAIINDESKAGLTAHIISNELDAGDILNQIEIQIETFDTGYSLLQKYFDACPVLIDKLLNSIKEGTLSRTIQNNKAATYFSKRTPDDGLVNWDWQRRRIINWVRALSPPYPGAFTYYQGQRLIIQQAHESNFGFYDSMPNGSILGVEAESVIVKVPNGALELLLDKNQLTSLLKTGERFKNE